MADLLAEIGVPYDSEQSVQLGSEAARFITETARKVSAELGRTRGSFPAFGASVWRERGFDALRNATVTCVAPTGTIGVVAGASGGIEPFFALATRRRVLEGRTFIEMNNSLERQLKQFGSAGEAALELARETGSIREAVGIPEELRRIFPVALEIALEFHLRIQAAFQEHVDAAVSKTVNLPADSSPDMVREVFLRAHDLGLKGVTVYRYGSRARQTLSLADEAAAPDCRECSD